jgi:hypothetical protein
MIHEGSLRKRVDAKRVGHAEVKGLALTSAMVPVPLLHFPSPSLGGGLDCPPLRRSSDHHPYNDPSKLARYLSGMGAD